MNRNRKLTRKLTLFPGGRFAMAECDNQGRPIVATDKLPVGVPIYGAERYRYRREVAVKASRP